MRQRRNSLAAIRVRRIPWTAHGPDGRRPIQAPQTSGSIFRLPRRSPASRYISCDPTTRTRNSPRASPSMALMQMLACGEPVDVESRLHLPNRPTLVLHGSRGRPSIGPIGWQPESISSSLKPEKRGSRIKTTCDAPREAAAVWHIRFLASSRGPRTSRLHFRAACRGHTETPQRPDAQPHLWTGPEPIERPVDSTAQSSNVTTRLISCSHSWTVATSGM